MKKYIKIYLHNIEYEYFDFDMTMDEYSEEHIKNCIKEGYSGGELIYEDDKIFTRGWWNIKKV